MICKTVSFTANSKPLTATVDQKYLFYFKIHPLIFKCRVTLHLNTSIKNPSLFQKHTKQSNLTALLKISVKKKFLLNDIRYKDTLYSDLENVIFLSSPKTQSHSYWSPLLKSAWNIPHARLLLVCYERGSVCNWILSTFFGIALGMINNITTVLWSCSIFKRKKMIRNVVR